LNILSHAGLPLGPWSGRAVLIFLHTAWFSDGSAPLVGLLAAGLGPSPGGIELAGDLPRLRPGLRLESDGGRWFLEGIGELTGIAGVPDSTVHLPQRLSMAPTEAWKQAWAKWLGECLPSTAEGRWLASLGDGPGMEWEGLVGRGSGSTPVGDDYLAGWLAARQVRGWFTTADRNRLLQALDRTSRLSRHFLWHLADGRVHKMLASVLASASPLEPDSPETAGLARQGDLSGRATLAGLVAGLSTGTSNDQP